VFQHDPSAWCEADQAAARAHHREAPEMEPKFADLHSRPRPATLHIGRRTATHHIAMPRNTTEMDRLNMQSVARLKSGTLASATETIQLNDVESDLEKARFDHMARNLALQQEYNAKRDKLRAEYHERVQEITGSAA
jgi:hypothetical protein